MGDFMILCCIVVLYCIVVLCCIVVLYCIVALSCVVDGNFRAGPGYTEYYTLGRGTLSTIYTGPGYPEYYTPGQGTRSTVHRAGVPGARRILSFFPQHIVVGLLNFGRKRMVVIAGFPFSGTPRETQVVVIVVVVVVVVPPFVVIVVVVAM